MSLPPDSTVPSAPLLSVVSPVYFGAALLDELVERLHAALGPLTPHYEIILVDDRSPDESWARIEAQAHRDARVRGIRLSRNFGQHHAITAGLADSRGQWVVVMDCDLQDRPEEIPQLFAAAQQGRYNLVLARRVARQDSRWKRWVSRSFYRVLSYLTDTEQDPDVANFGLYDRKVVDAVLSMPERIRYLPTMVRWVGFRVATLPVTHARRPQGESSYSLGRLFDLGLNIILAYSDKPLRLTVKLGLSLSATAFLLALVTLVRFFLGQIQVLGYTSLIISIWFFSGLLLSVLGVVGLYLGKTFEQVKNRPLYIVDERTDRADGSGPQGRQ
ncbi:glycosyltransferase family 2 protein [Hymenobacter sp. CRA2]|uniref:glycosyltransferase family 2 protein n=1 Tax=Hymenobacter sp. CRA2 TaxID=1955620 RepID=UPI00098FCE17|nr:glycosyltransferase family 2 protein [Hymenobacter sp. CRA2]OON65917.1 glycosyltransferase [Hymenobacter sp. CRA2]